MPVGVAIATALLPTVGHVYLANFMARFMKTMNGRGHLILSTLSDEPTTFREREVAFQSIHNLAIYHHSDDLAPLVPKEGSEWRYWADMIKSKVGGRVDFLFCSEPYGITLAKYLNAELIAVDPNREIFPVKGTNVRTELYERQDEIAPLFLDRMKTDFVLFGAESMGKTTLAKKLAEKYRATYVPEYARPYLKMVGSEITLEKLDRIVRGQLVNESIETKTIFRFFDTDLLTTLGFYLYNGFEPPAHLLNAVQRYKEQNPKRVYFLLDDKSIPFTPDPIRYGGDRRETETAFWEKLLIGHGMNYRKLKDNRFASAYVGNYPLGKLGCTAKELRFYQRRN